MSKEPSSGKAVFEAREPTRIGTYSSGNVTKVYAGPDRRRFDRRSGDARRGGVRYGSHTDRRESAGRRATDVATLAL